MSKTQKSTFEISSEDLMDATTVTVNPYWLEAHIAFYKKMGRDPAWIAAVEKNIARLKILFPKIYHLKESYE